MANANPMRPDIAQAWAQINNKMSRDVRKLVNYVTADERVLAMGAGSNGIVVPTDRRVLFIDEGFTKKWFEDFAYDRITTVTVKRGFMYSTLIVTAVSSYSLADMSKPEADRIAAIVRNHVETVTRHRAAASAQPYSVPPVHNSVSTELRQLAELRDSGVLTEDEFNEQKRRLLAH
jgi:hypothetical protein